MRMLSMVVWAIAIVFSLLGLYDFLRYVLLFRSMPQIVAAAAVMPIAEALIPCLVARAVDGFISNWFLHRGELHARPAASSGAG